MRPFGGLAAALLSSLALAPGCGRRDTTAEQIVLVTLDTTRADRLGCYGRQGAETPAIDRLAEEGTLFEQVVAAVPVTMPSHATMMTGLQPYRHGVRYNVIRVLPESFTTLAERLRAAGYKTGAVVSATVLDPRYGLGQGFEVYDGPPDARQLGVETERKAAEAIDRALAWWGAHPKDKRFLWVHLYDPHYPYEPPFPYSSRFADRPYEGEIASMDGELRRLFDRLAKDGDWERTLVVVAGDHGEGLYEHGERWHAGQVYETTIRVPLVVKPPRGGSGARVQEPVALVDLTPTILDYAGIATSDPMDGISLREAVRSGSAPLRTLYYESTTAAINYGWSPLHGVRRGKLKYFEGGRREMYDLAADPGETRDLAQGDPQGAADLAAELASFLEASDDADRDAGVPILDDETLAQLTSLGYVGGPSTTLPARGKGIHPPDLAGLDQEVLRAQEAVAAERWAEAGAALDFVLKRDPTNQFALYFRAKAFAATGANDRAIEVARVLARLSPDSVSAVDLIGEILASSGKRKEAAEHYRQALERAPKEFLYRFHLVLVLVDSRDFEAAEAEQGRLEADFPTAYSTAMGRALVEAARGRVPASIAALGQAIDRGLTTLKPVEGSPWFRTVREDPAYRGLVSRLAAGSR